MKTSLKVVLLVLLFTGFTANAQKKTITVKELPQTAQTFITNNFKGQTVSFAVKEKEMMDTDYTVQLSGGFKLEFDKNGNWEEINGNGKAVPAAIIPKNIADYVAKNQKGHKIIKIEKDKMGYDVDLSNGLGLDFDSNGKFLKVDD